MPAGGLRRGWCVSIWRTGCHLHYSLSADMFFATLWFLVQPIKESHRRCVEIPKTLSLLEIHRYESEGPKDKHGQPLGEFEAPPGLRDPSQPKSSIPTKTTKTRVFPAWNILPTKNASHTRIFNLMSPRTPWATTPASPLCVPGQWQWHSWRYLELQKGGRLGEGFVWRESSIEFRVDEATCRPCETDHFLGGNVWNSFDFLTMFGRIALWESW